MVCEWSEEVLLYNGVNVGFNWAGGGGVKKYNAMSEYCV